MSSCSAVASSVRLTQPNQLASSSSPRTRDVGEARAARPGREVVGRERVDVDERLERLVVEAVVLARPASCVSGIA